ncbi:hypothetical protein [Modestobacter sp. SSW1-42]|uniref:hypothetical protein n=1 Tax=Modestobacter sp. SSW1-42 TaxID=596372 RepID=UPI0039873887
MTTCGSVALLTPELVIELDQLQADWPGDEVWGCDFDAEHPGKHCTIAAYAAEGEELDHWLLWSAALRPAQLLRARCCEATLTAAAEVPVLCCWISGHPGQHAADTTRW